MVAVDRGRIVQGEALKSSVARTDQRELEDYFRSGMLQATLPLTASRIRKALGMRAGARRLLWLLCLCVLALGVLATYLNFRLNASEREMAELTAAGDGTGPGAAADAADGPREILYTTNVRLSRGVVPYERFARVCRCVSRPARALPTHIVRFEALVQHIYGDANAAATGRSQLVTGISLYDVSGAGYCDAYGEGAGGDDAADEDPRAENHACDDQLGARYGASAKLLWQYSPLRRGEGTDDAVNFRLPAESGIRLEQGRAYDFVARQHHREHDRAYRTQGQPNGAYRGIYWTSPNYKYASTVILVTVRSNISCRYCCGSLFSRLGG